MFTSSQETGLDERQVSVSIGPDDVSLILTAIVETYSDVGAEPDDVPVGRGYANRVYEHTAAKTVRV